MTAHPVLLAALVLTCAAAASTATAQPAAPANSPAVASAPADAPAERGRLAWYGRKFTGRPTASGEAYNPEALTMAHKTLPFGTRVKVTNPASRQSVVLRVNDRGPTQVDRVGDVSLAAARRLSMLRPGVIDAELAVVSNPAPAKR